jgi:hypothetical protein
MTGRAAELEGELRGRLCTVLAAGGDEASLNALKEDASRVLGAEHPVTLLIEAGRQRTRSYRRPVAHSVDAWAQLRDQAARALAPADATLLAIRSHYIRYLRLRGAPGDLDEVIRLREEELAFRAGQLPDRASLLGIAKADLAVALVDRARSSIRCTGLAGAPPADLTRASELIEGELRRRTETYPRDSSVVQLSRLILSDALVALAESTEGATRREYADRALVISDELLDYYWAAAGSRSMGVLKSRLAHAEALGLLDRAEDALRTARLACRVSGLVGQNIDRGLPVFVLARLQRPADPQAALASAARALAIRSQIFPQVSRRIAEIMEFIAAAR